MSKTIEEYEGLVHAGLLQITELAAENSRLRGKVEALSVALQAWKTSYRDAKAIAYMYHREGYTKEENCGLISFNKIGNLRYDSSWKEIELYARPSSKMSLIGYMHPLDVGRHLSMTTERISDEQVPVYAATGEYYDG